MNDEYMADVPESIRPYLNEIAERLWFDRAVVMVGAGFSKNAGYRWSSLVKRERTILARQPIETAYDKGNPDLAFDEKLEVRRISSILAAKLWTHYRSSGLSVPSVVEKWRDACMSPDEFSEIRNAWKDSEGV